MSINPPLNDNFVADARTAAMVRVEKAESVLTCDKRSWNFSIAGTPPPNAWRTGMGAVAHLNAVIVACLALQRQAHNTAPPKVARLLHRASGSSRALFERLQGVVRETQHRFSDEQRPRLRARTEGDFA